MSAGDNDDDDNGNEANKPSPWAGMDTDEGGWRQPDHRMASAGQELALSDTDAHGGWATSSNDVTNEGGGTEVMHRAASTDNNQPKHDMIKQIYVYSIIFTQKRNGKGETQG